MASGERWWPTRPPPAEVPTEVVMNTKRRETVGPVKVKLGFHDATIAVVCQEGCYPDKKAHVNQDCFACKPLFHEEGDAAKQMLIGVFDGHGPNGEHCASIAAHAFPDVLRRLRNDKSFASHGARDAKVPHREWDADEALQSYSRAFVDTDARVMEALGDGARSSGTTALVAHVIGDMLHMGNVGDSRALLGVESRRNVSSTDSAPSSPARSPLRGTRRDFSAADDVSPRWDVVEVSHDQTCFRNDERERMKKEAVEPVMFATLGMILGETPMSEDFGEESIEAADDPPRPRATVRVVAPRDDASGRSQSRYKSLPAHQTYNWYKYYGFAGQGAKTSWGYNPKRADIQEKYGAVRTPSERHWPTEA